MKTPRLMLGHACRRLKESVEEARHRLMGFRNGCIRRRALVTTVGWLIFSYLGEMYFFIPPLTCSTIPLSLRVCSIAAPTSSSELNGFDFPGAMP